MLTSETQIKTREMEKDLFSQKVTRRRATPRKPQPRWTVFGACLSLYAPLVSGCAANNIHLEKYSQYAPLVVVSDGLLSEDARKFFSELCREENAPYVGADCMSWKRNTHAIEEAHRQGRKIILVGYSAGTDQARLTAEWCDKKGIPVDEMIYFDPTHLTYWGWAGIPENVRAVTNYLSERDVLDAVWVGKGRAVKKSDLKNPRTVFANYELNGTHIGIFRNNRDRLKKDLGRKIKDYMNSNMRNIFAYRQQRNVYPRK